MDCQSCSHFLSDYIDSTLGAHQATLVREHLLSCRRCREEQEALLRVRTLLGALPAPSARPDFWSRAYATVRLHAAMQTQPRARWTLWGSALRERFAVVSASYAALGILVGAVLALLFVLPMHLPHANSPAVSHPARTQANRAPQRPDSGKLALAQAFAKPITADSLVALHAYHNAGLPLSDSGRMHYIGSEADEADLDYDGKLDFH